MTSETSPEARTGARWWANKIREQFTPDNGSGEPTHPFVGGLIAANQQLDAATITPEKIDAYEAALAVEIQKIIDEHGHATYFGALRLGCDYGPGEAHETALKAAGIRASSTILPWKTTMWVEPGCVRVGDGYRAEPRELELLA